MGAPPKVQPMFASYTLRITRLHYTHGCTTLSAAYVLLALPKESLGYTALMGAPPKVQPMYTKVQSRARNYQHNYMAHKHCHLTPRR